MKDVIEAVPLSVREQGNAGGPALLILHGLFGSAMNWGRIARALEADHHIFLLDLRNHGQSPHHPDMSYPTMAGDVLEVMNTHQLQRATVLGHSMGGKVAMQLALTNGDRLRGLIVADIAPVRYGGNGHGRLIDAMARLDLERLGSRTRASEDLAPAVPEPGIRQFLLTNLVKQDGAWRWRIPLDILRDNLDGIGSWPDTPGTYDGPALFVHGGKSDYVSAQGRKLISKQFPAAAIATMDNCGHWLHAEDPEGFVDHVGGFLQQISG